MTLLDALRVITENIKIWAESKFLKKDEVTASDVGALSDTTVIPSKLSDLTTDSTHRTVTDSEKDNWNAKANMSAIPTKVSDLTNDSGYLISYTETDPTVPAWAKASTKPKYTASEVGADASGTAESVVSTHNSATNSHSDIRTSIQNLQTKVNGISVPTKLSQLTNDNGYITSYTETDPTVPTWAKASSKPTYTKSEIGLGNVDNVKQYSTNNPPPYPVTSVNKKTGAVNLTYSDVGADSSGAASSLVSDHNVAADSHTDIRTALNQKQAKGDYALQSDIPTKVSQLTNDNGYITGYTEADPTVPSWAKASSKPTYSKSEIGLGNVDNVKQYSTSNPPPYPVTSVNGKTGKVTISALPSVTTSDNGKVLMVVNGAWSVVDLNMSVDTNGVVSI